MSESLVYEKKRRCFYSVTRANLNKNHCVIRGKKEGEGGEKEGGEKKERKKRKSKIYRVVLPRRLVEDSCHCSTGVLICVMTPVE
jgi:hypothetical protein